MENEYRYRMIAPDFSRLLSFALYFVVALSVTNFVIGAPMMFVLQIAFGVLSVSVDAEGLRVASVLGVVGFLLTEFAAIMAALWACMRWGKFSGAAIKFVRPNLVDVAASKKGVK